jgi:hypothetical protein
MEQLVKAKHLSPTGRQEVGKILLSLAQDHTRAIAELQDRVDSLVMQKEALLEKARVKDKKKK